MIHKVSGTEHFVANCYATVYHKKCFVALCDDSHTDTEKALFVLFVCFDSLHPCQQFFSHVGKGFPGLNQYEAEDKCLAQGHNPVPPLMLKPAIPGSRVKHSMTEPPHSSKELCGANCCLHYNNLS